jgi:hypothetical protein
MKKVNLKGKLNLKKETLSKLDMTSVSGGATALCAQSLICGGLQSKLVCPSVQVQCFTQNACFSRNIGCTQSIVGCPTGPTFSQVC